MIRFTLWKARPGNLLRAGNRGVDAATSPVVRNNLGEGKMSELLRRFLNDDSGATAIEYGLIAAGISVAIIAVVNTLGTNLNTTFSSISSQLK
jgi:pilus assembly protein Flp/PilA